jgi:DNA-binding HxlR family transcriptional regulator
MRAGSEAEMGEKRFGPYFCGIDAAMDVISGKWKGLILWELENYGVRRFGELRRGLPGVSEKMLIQQLRELEEDGLVDRKVHPEVPPRVEYRLTGLGRSLNSALAPLGAWGRERIERIGAARIQPPGEPSRTAAGQDAAAK